MRLNIFPLLFSTLVCIAVFGFVSRAEASAGAVYITQTAGSNPDGLSCTTAKDFNFFNTATNWGNGATQIGPSTVVHVCGTIANQLVFQSSGSYNQPITLYFEPNAKISRPVGTLLSIFSKNFIVIDGGSNGVLENTDNGTLLGNKQAVSGIYAPGSGDLEIKNLTIQNLYVHTSGSDSNIDFTPAGGIYLNGFRSNISIHNNTFHDICWIINGGGTSGASNFNVYSNTFYNYDHAIAGIGGSMANPANVNIYNNHFGSTANWDTAANTYHHDGVHIYFNAGGSLSGVSIFNNLFDGDWGVNNTAHLYLQGVYGVHGSLVNFYIYNNVFLSPPGGYLNNGFMAGAGINWNVYNNTFIGSGVTGSSCVGSGGQGLNFKNNIISGCTVFFSSVDNNIFATNGLGSNVYANATPGGNSPWKYNGISYNSFAAWKAVTNQEINSVQVSSASLSSDGHPQSGSPALTIGSNLTPLGIFNLNLDKAGSGRPSSNTWDAGAYQITGGVVPPPIIPPVNPPVNPPPVNPPPANPPPANPPPVNPPANTPFSPSNAPTITLFGNNPAYVRVGVSWSDPGVQVVGGADFIYNVKANVNGKDLGIANNLFIDTHMPVVYTIIYTTTDSQGRTATATRTVYVTFTGQPDANSPAQPIQPVVPAQPAQGLKLTLTKTLSIGSKNSEVTLLQNYLITTNYLATGNNTGFFGNLTRTAVRKYQCEKMQICSGDEGTTGYGMVGRMTRAQFAK